METLVAMGANNSGWRLQRIFALVSCTGVVVAARLLPARVVMAARLQKQTAVPVGYGGARWGQRLQESGDGFETLEVGMVIDISTWVVTPRGVLGASDRVAQC